MHFLLDLLVLAILGFCAWQGYKRGLIAGIIAVVFIIVAIYGGNLIANTFSGEFNNMFRPFASGYLDRVEIEAVELVAPEEMHDYSTEDLFRIEPDVEPLVVRQMFIELGVHHSRAEQLTERYLDGRAEGLSVNQAMTDVTVEAFTFYLVYVIGFLLILIALTVVYNIIRVSFRLPGLKMVDEIGGAVAGFIQGLMLVFMLGWALGYAGLIFPEGFLLRTWVTELFIGANPMVIFINL